MSRTSVAYPPSFYMYLKDPHAYWDMVEGLESRYRVEQCSFNTIFGSFEGHRIFASRKVAEKIEMKPETQPNFTTYMSGRITVMAEKDLFYCGDNDESRFFPTFKFT